MLGAHCLKEGAVGEKIREEKGVGDWSRTTRTFYSYCEDWAFALPEMGTICEF